MRTSQLLDRAAAVIETLADATHGEFCSNGGDPIHCTDLSKGRGCVQFLEIATQLRDAGASIQAVCDEHQRDPGLLGKAVAYVLTAIGELER